MPYIHISRPGQSAEDADRMIAAGKEMGKFRQCSLGYHDECSDPDGDECTCLCHSETGHLRLNPDPRTVE